MKAAIFIPVRVGSSRLPNKALLQIKGRTIIEHLIDRVKLARLPDLIVICTTVSLEDAILVEIAKNNNIEYFRGNERDILDRYWKAALEYNVDFIVNTDGDDIFCDPNYIDKVVESFMREQSDFIQVEGLPFGAAPCGIKVNALERACLSKIESDTETGWSRYFTDSGRFKVKKIEVDDESLRAPEIRMTLDYVDDYKFFVEVFERLYVSGEVFGLKEIIALLRSDPSIIDMNRHLQEEYWETFHRKASRIQWKNI
ncbi:cytidylyltransferase domain-containing protein [Chloroflexota bacterium]